jgi:serine/arginine repetitive matrix protein 2
LLIWLIPLGICSFHLLAIAGLRHISFSCLHFTNSNRSSRESSFDQLSTPNPESLPYLEKGPPSPLSDPDLFSANRHHLFAIANEMKGIIKKEFDDENDEQEALRSEFRELYINWKQRTLDLDRTRENDENALKQSSPEAPFTAATQELSTAPLPTLTEGGRRANRFATDYEMQRILELSLQEDRERRQKEREAKEAQANASRDREAYIPDMLPPAEIARRTFEDNSQARQPRDAIRIFDFVPPPDDFTEEEDRLLRQEYATNIKAWGRIAKTVGNGRTYKECINHYYATKWDRPYEKKQRGRKGRRGGKKPLSGKKSALVPAGDTDMVDADGSTPLVTDSGRPRRAAAPQWPKDPDAEQGPLVPQGKKVSAGGKYDGAKEGEPGTEKPGRRKGTKEKAPRKARNQPLAARPTASSPQKADKEGKDKIVPMTSEDRPMWEAMPQLLPTQPVYAESGAADILKAGISAPTERARSHSQSQRQGASSYWSVVEEHDFRKCLEYFGTDFQAIANHMGSKTQTMVSILGFVVCEKNYTDLPQIKNHFHKLVSDGKNLDLVQKANEATHRRNRGDAIGPPPVPTQPPKRRYDPIQTPMPRTLAPNTEVIDLENSPSQSVMPLHVSPPQFAPQIRFPAQPPAARQSNAAGEPRTHQDPVIPAQNPAPRPHHPPGPRMGFFVDDARSAVAHAFQQPAHQATQQPTRPVSNQNETNTQRIARIKTEHDNNPSRNPFSHPPGPSIAEQDAERERERLRVERDLVQQQHHQSQSQRAIQDTRARMQAAVDARAQLELEEREPDQLHQRQQQPNFFRSTGGQMQPSMYPRPGASEPSRAEQHFPQTQFGIQVTPISSASSPIVDLTGPSLHQPQPRPFSPSLRAVRPPSPVHAPPALNAPPQRTMTPTPAPAPAPALPAKEPPKRLNIMSMLNPEPEEERPRRREPEINTPVSSGTPAQQYRPHLPPSESGTPREPFGEPRPYSRPTFPPSHHTPGSSVSTPTSESAPRDGLPPMGHRDSWPGPRPAFQGLPMQQQHQVGSPLSQPQHGPPMPEPRGSLFNRDYRSATFGSLNQARHVPSPPPAAGGAYSHSRTPSYTQNAQAQHSAQSSAPLATGAGPSLNLRQNPYARKDGPPAPSSQPHLHGSQVVHAQNEANHSHNRYAQYEPPQQDPRREAMFDRFRERPSEVPTREQQHRDQMLAQQQHQHQHRFGGHHTPPVTQPQFAPPERSGPTPLSHPTYAPPPDAGQLQHPDSRSQQQLEYQAELRRRDYERERQRQERMETEAQYRNAYQAQNQQRLYDDRMRAHQGWEPGPGPKQ